MVTWTRKLVAEKESYISDEKVRLVYNIILDFKTKEEALYFRRNFWRESIKENNKYNYYIEPQSYKRELELFDNQIDKNYNGDIPLDTLHFEFKIYTQFYLTNKDNSNVEQDVKNTIKSEFENNFNAKVQIQFLPPKGISDNDKVDGLSMVDRKDTLFETLSTSDIRQYDFVIVAKDKTEAETIKNWYINSYETNEYTTKTELKNSYFAKNQLSFIKTTSDELENGIYCLTNKANNYFNYIDIDPIIPIFYNVKASQLGGKVIIAKLKKKAKENENLFSNEMKKI